MQRGEPTRRRFGSGIRKNWRREGRRRRFTGYFSGERKICSLNQKRGLRKTVGQRNLWRNWLNYRMKPAETTLTLNMLWSGLCFRYHDNIERKETMKKTALSIATLMSIA